MSATLIQWLIITNKINHQNSLRGVHGINKNCCKVRDFFWIVGRLADIKSTNRSGVSENINSRVRRLTHSTPSTAGRQALMDFLIARQSEYPSLATKAAYLQFPFTKTYICEKGFSTLALTKCEIRSSLDAEDGLRLKLFLNDPGIT